MRWRVWALAALAACLVGCPEYNLRPNTQIDVYFQEVRNVVDVLLVVDNSCSMIDEQEKLADNFQAFIDAFEGANVDYQIGVVTTDQEQEHHRGNLRCAADVVGTEVGPFTFTGGETDTLALAFEPDGEMVTHTFDWGLLEEYCTVDGDEATCSDDGLCIGPDGEPEDFWAFPIMDLKSASGAAFLDVKDIAHIPDHYLQAISDLATLRWSLASEPTWTGVYGRDIRTEEFHYVGMSLGSLIGSVWIPFEPSIDRIVLNVAGSNMVDLFLDSTYFGPQIDIFLEELDIEPGTFEAERMLTFASWLVDAVDPLSVAHLYAEQEREAMIQYDKVNDEIGDIIIPNHVTEELQRASGLPIVQYPSFIHVDLIVPLIGNGMLDDAADWLGEDLDL